MRNLSLVFLLILFSSINIYAQKSQQQQNTQSENKQITLEDIWKYYKFYPKTVSGFRSMNDGENYTILNKGSIEKYAYKNGKLQSTIINAGELMDNTNNTPLMFSDYEFNNDETKLLLVTNAKPIYRHSFSADYWVYDLKSKSLTKLSNNGDQRLATFSPNGDKVAFMRDNNLFIKDLSNNNEIQITNDGKLNHIINGAPDWVYEEEFSFTRAFEWSDNGQQLAYIKFDESKVKEYELQYYGDLYPGIVKYKYPKAGEDNSIVNVFVYNLENKKTTKMDIGSNTDIYIPRIKWTHDNNILSIQRLNRLQNHWEILLANAGSGTTKVLYSEKNKYYIDITDNLIFTKDNKSFIFNSEKDGYNHIYQYDMNGKQMLQINKGKYDVTEFLGYDDAHKRLYFQAAYSSPINREIFAVSLKNLELINLSTKTGTNDAVFSSNFKYFLNTNTTANTPHYVTMCNNKGKELYVIQDNKQLIKTTQKYNFSKEEFFKFTTEDNVELNGYMIKPKDFDPNKKYPVLMYVYGGPGSQTVLNSWGWFNYAWFQMLAQKGYIVVSVDNRGTGARGQEFKKMTYLQLGKYETQDQINATKYLASIPYIDGKRIGIFGWSYGGYMSSLCMTKGADNFKTGIAVAPVTNWKYYDNIYTERYMRTPQTNNDGYEDNSPINHTKLLKGKFLLVHGIADDNVHVQNSMDLITALVKNNKQFEMQFYPNSDHGIHAGRNTRLHLYIKMTDFILDNL
jgi:dipeptidyl-peptidase-4